MPKPENHIVVMTTMDGILNFQFEGDLCHIVLKPDDGGGDVTIVVPRFKMKWVADAMREFGDIT